MKKAYIQNTSLIVKADIDLGEINQVIDVLQDIVGDESECNNWEATTLLRKFKALRREAVDDARRDFESMFGRV